MNVIRLSIVAVIGVGMCAIGARAQEAGSPEGAAPAATQPSAANTPAVGEISAELDPAIERGLRALADMQEDDGAFSGGRYGKHVGITALACLAFMADGHMPGRGEYGRVIDRGLEFILDNVNETGLIAAETSHGPMYGHGFAALFLGEVYGMTAGDPDSARSARVYDALVKANRLIVQTQNEEGGWRYNPVPHDADISVTICQIMALRSARNAGIEIPKQTIDRAIEYVNGCHNTQDGGFRYQLGRGSSAWPRSAAGVASLFYAGVYEGEVIDRGVEYLEAKAFPGKASGIGGSHYYYGHYYAVQAMFLAGGPSWEAWWPAIREELLNRQVEDGTWLDAHAGNAYGSAMALIILQMPKRYLPIFQK